MADSKKRKILDELNDFMRLHHYSIHTERAYCDWIRRFIRFHNMTKLEDIHGEKEKKIESFLTHLASEENVAPATQNQAMNALILIPQNASGQGDRCRPFPKENQCPRSTHP